MNCSKCEKKFTLKQRKKITCPSCNINTCLKCIRESIDEDILKTFCYSCQKSYKNDFLEQILPPVVYKKCALKDPYQKVKLVGKGGFGECNLVRNDDKLYIMKESKESRLNYSIENEIEIHKKLNHIHIVPYMGSLSIDRKSCILLYPCIHGSLTDFLAVFDIPHKNQMIIMEQLLSGIEYLHKNRILHRDIKPDNILFDEFMNVKIGDFGVSKYMEKDKYYTECGTSNYRAPETFLKRGYSFPVDIWSFGVTCYQLITRTLPFYHKDKKIQKNKIFSRRIYQSEKLEGEKKKFIYSILMSEERGRPRIDELKKFFKK